MKKAKQEKQQQHSMSGSSAPAGVMSSTKPSCSMGSVLNSSSSNTSSVSMSSLDNGIARTNKSSKLIAQQSAVYPTNGYKSPNTAALANDAKIISPKQNKSDNQVEGSAFTGLLYNLIH